MSHASPQSPSAWYQRNLASSAVGLGAKLVAYLVRLSGGVARWAEDKLHESISVADFGAVGDSSGASGNGTDNTAAFVAAIAACMASSNRPRRLVVPDGWYRLTDSLVVDTANQMIAGETKRVILWCDHDDIGLSITSNGAQYTLDNLDVRRCSGKTGTGVQVRAPEGKMRGVKIFNHATGLNMQDAHLTKIHDIQISGCTAIGFEDNGRCFGSTMVDPNIILNETGASFKSDWTIISGAIEQNGGTDVYVSTSADYNGQYFGKLAAFGVHFEVESGNPTATDVAIQVGPTGAAIPAARIGWAEYGCWHIGNSSARTAIQFRQCKQASIKGSAFFGFAAGATMIAADAQAQGLRFGGNHWDGTGTYKNINASVVDYIDEDTEIDTYNGMSLTHGSNGGKLKGVQEVKSAPRGANLVIASRRNTANASALSLQTPGTDNTTLFERIACSSGADVGTITFPSAKLEVSGTYTSPFKIGTAYFWINSGKLYIKDGSLPSSAADGTIVGTQT